MLELGLGPDPNESFKTIDARHFDIEKKKGGNRVLSPIRVQANAREIVDELLAIADDAKLMGKTRLGQAAPHQKNIIGAVVGNQDGSGGWHRDGKMPQERGTHDGVIAPERGGVVIGWQRGRKEFSPQAWQ